MKEFIRKIQNKPESTRLRILYLSMAVVGGLLLLLWIFILNKRFDAVEAATFKRDLKPLGLIKESLVDIYSGNKK